MRVCEADQWWYIPPFLRKGTPEWQAMKEQGRKIREQQAAEQRAQQSIAPKRSRVKLNPEIKKRLP